jgi:hypothetical protein
MKRLLIKICSNEYGDGKRSDRSTDPGTWREHQPGKPF